MSSPRSFEILLAVSRMLEDELIDEDISDVTEGDNSQTVSNRTITVRGKRQGTPVVLCYQDLYSTNFNPRARPSYERNVLEIFVAQPRVTFEGTLRPCGWHDRMLRWIRVGANRGPHPIFSRLHVTSDDDESSPACFDHPGFAEAVEAMVLRPEVLRVQLQLGSGITVVTRLHPGHSSPPQVMHMLDEVRTVAAVLGYS